MKILILGVGNILLKDEGIGVHIINKLNEQYKFPDNVEILDGGTLGLYLMPKLEEGFDIVMVIDALKTEDKPGSIYRFSMEDIPYKFPNKISPHEIGLFETLTLVQLRGIEFKTIIFGIVPREIKAWGMDFSIELKDAVNKVMGMILNELKEIGISYSSK
ncbi:MAG: HyaD/HybD family hydrogenase maturation endopeptidase [Spirochaetia bacterium]|nr:HyaD/HybD family hydrogenase maturation endopeptidase [Spirochaetia bacterium]